MKKKTWRWVTLAAVVLLVSACQIHAPHAHEEPVNGPGYEQIDAKTAKERMDKETGYLILDVRTDEEYAEGHIPGAVLIPDYEVRERAEEELPDKGQRIFVYCRSGNRSKTASAILADLGYTNVVEFGGIRDWPYEIEK